MVTTEHAAPSETRPSAAGRLLLVSTYLLGSIVVVMPLFMVEVPALVDYPNHLARMHILALLDERPYLGDFYRVDWSPVPNLIMDFLTPPLIRVFGTYAAGKIVLGAVLLLPVAGVAALHAALYRRLGIWPAAAFLFVYNQPFTWGFLNFLFTSGLALMALAAWIATSGWSPWRRLALGTVFSVLLYFGHFFALATYALAVAGYELSRLLGTRRGAGRLDVRAEARSWGFAMGQFLAPAALLLLVPSWGGTKVTDYGTFGEKLLALLSPILSYGRGELLAGLAVLAVLGALVWTGHLKVAPRMRVVLAILAVAALAMPRSLEGNWLADIRLPVLILWIFIASSRFAASNHRLGLVIACGFALLLVGNTLRLSDIWRDYDRQYAEFREAAARVIEPGSRVLPVQVDKRLEEVPYRNFPAPYWYLASLAVIDQGIFHPLLFTNPSAQPVLTTPPVAHLDVTSGMPPWPESLLPATSLAGAAPLLDDPRHGHGPIYWREWQRHYDYVLVTRMEFDQPNPAPGLLEPVARGSFFDIYRVLDAEPSD